MKIQRLSSVAASLVAAQFLWSAPVQATLISDVQDINATLSSATPVYSSALAGTSFDLTDDGVPGSATVNWARVSFSLMDLDGRSDDVYAFFTGDMLTGESNPYGFTGFGGLVSGTVVGALNLSGMLDYTLAFAAGAAGSWVTVTKGSLVADVTSVPEPATMSLLGAGLLAAWLGRRRRTRTQ
jgi:hypothetical protein